MRRYYRGIRFATHPGKSRAYGLVAHAYQGNTDVMGDLKNALVQINDYVKAVPEDTKAKEALERIKTSLALAQKIMVELTYAASKLKNS